MTEWLNVAMRKLRVDNDEIVRGGDKTDDKNPSKKSKNTKSRIWTRIKIIKKSIFIILDTNEVFNQLRQAFTKTPIFWHFDPKCYIQIKINALGDGIEKVLSQLTSDYLTSD